MSDHLAGGYDLAIFDLDGVVFLIDKPIPGAADAVERLRADGTSIAYATNNASRRAGEVATLLTGMGVSAAPAEVLVYKRQVHRCWWSVPRRCAGRSATPG